MRKFCTFILSVFIVASCLADVNVPSLELVKNYGDVERNVGKKNVSLSEETVDAQVTILQTVVSDSVAYVLWYGGAPAYDIQLAVINAEAEYGYELIAEGAWNSNVLAYGNNDSIYVFSTDLLLKYGYTYLDDSTYFSKDACVNNVTENFKLKPNTYVLFIEGIDADFNTVEKYAGRAFVIEEPISTGIINNTVNSNINSKVLFNGRLYICSKDGIYDVIGNKVK